MGYYRGGGLDEHKLSKVQQRDGDARFCKVEASRKIFVKDHKGGFEKERMSNNCCILGRRDTDML